MGELAAGDAWAKHRRRIIRNGVVVGLTTGLYAPAFGAVASAAGLSLLQTCLLSLLMFTGASQFALVGVLGGGGGAAAAAATAVLLGARNMFYALGLSALLRVRGVRRLLTAQLVIDESTAMSIGAGPGRAGRIGFYATGISVYIFWNLGTLIRGLAAHALPDPRSVGLDAAAPAAFVALLAPHVSSRTSVGVAVVAAAVGVALVPALPAGVPILAAALVAIVAGATLQGTPDVVTGEAVL